MLLAFLGNELQSCWQLPSAPVYCNSSRWCQQALGCTRRRVTSRSTEVIIPICSALVDRHISDSGFSSQLPTTTQTGPCCSKSVKGHEDDEETGVSDEMLRELGLFILEKKGTGDLTVVYEYPMGWLKKMKSDSKWCPVKGQEAIGRNGNTRNTISTLTAPPPLLHFSTKRVTTQTGCGVSILGNSQNLTVPIPKEPALADCALTRCQTRQFSEAPSSQP